MTTFKTTLAALILAAAPGLALAGGGCSGMMGAHSETAQMSCAEGSALNPETNLCEPVVTG